MSILRMLLVASMIMGFTIAIILLVLYLYANQRYFKKQNDTYFQY